MSNNRYELEEDEAEEGFERAEALNDESYIIASKMDEGELGTNGNTGKYNAKKNKAQFLIKQKPKIRFDPLEMFPLTSRKKGDSEKYMKSMSLQKTIFEEPSNPQMLRSQERQPAKEGVQGRNPTLEELIDAAIVKTKRNQIGEDLIIKGDDNLQGREAKEGDSIKVVFKRRLCKGTHDIFKELGKYANSSFLQSKYNALLRANLEKTPSRYQETPKFSNDQIKFEACHESSNLNYVTKVTEEEYNLFLSVDTNTRGHQSWFYFSISNNKPTEQAILINICNMKRKFPMIKHGQGVYKRSQGKEWEFIQEVEIECTEKKKYRLSFLLKLQGLQKVEVSLIPPYTYSDLLRDVESYEKSPNVKIDILTYSLAGLAIPILTLTKAAKNNTTPKNRNMYLITARIHPSQTCSSFIVASLIQQLLYNREYEDFLKNNVVKIVPMVNPDGVIFGNFRTNYLGVDLNRSFHFMDEQLYPETVALKQLGRKCKEEYGNSFVCYLDLHGHSSQASSFIYGPQYAQGCENYVECRILPKILDKVSSYFRYDYSSFRLEEYKFNTARGFFFKKLKIPSYTIETSYALYCRKTSDEEKSYHRLGVQEWQQLGRSIANGLKINFECLSTSQEQKQLKQQGNDKDKEQRKKRIQSINKIQQNPNFAKYLQSKSSFLKLKKEIINEIKNEKGNFKTISSKKEQSDNDSDGQDPEQDLSQQQKSLIIKRLTQTVRTKSIFPKVLKESKDPAPSIPPQGIPTFYIGNQRDISILERINSKFKNKRYNRPVNISQEYTEYLLRNITGVSSMRPEVISFNPKKCKPSPLKLASESP